MHRSPMSRARLIGNGIVYSLWGILTLASFTGTTRADLLDKFGWPVLIAGYAIATPIALLPIRRIIWGWAHRGEYTNWGIMGAALTLNMAAVLYVPGQIQPVQGLTLLLAIMFVLMGRSVDKTNDKHGSYNRATQTVISMPRNSRGNASDN